MNRDERRKATKRGALIEEGCKGFLEAVLPPDPPEGQAEDMRAAFFCGAHFLYQSVCVLLDPKTLHITTEDVDVVKSMDTELKRFIEEMHAKARENEQKDS